MPHLSSKELDKELSEKLFNDLLSILNKSQDKKSMSGVVNELLTDTEKLMLAKRIAIVLLLNSKTPQSSISEILKVSTSTVAKISLKLEMGMYQSILKASEKDKNDFERIIYNIMTMGGIMPSKIGKRYWKKYSK
jgi:Trp operon repressor